MRPWLLTLPLLVGACGRPPAIEGVYEDRSSVVASTCGVVRDTIDDRATVTVDDDGAVGVDLVDVHFSGDATLRRRLTLAGDVTVADGTSSCGIVLPSGQVVDAAVTGAAATGVTATARTTTPVGPVLQERLERLAAADNVLLVRQTLRFTGTEVCGDGRLPTVPARDCELTRLIDLRLVQACPADCQRMQRLRVGRDAVFCTCGAAP